MSDCWTQQIILIRHGPVDETWKGVCYGQTDVPLCNQWKNDADSLIHAVALHRPHLIYHSEMTRTVWFVDRLRRQLQNDAPEHRFDVAGDPRLRERNFGQWEGWTWERAYQSDPDHFHDLIHRPDEYHPPDGETTSAMQRRVVQWFRNLAPTPRTVVACAHSGPIAALAGHLLKLPATDWTEWMIKPATSITIRRLPAGNQAGAGRDASDQFRVSHGLPEND